MSNLNALHESFTRQLPELRRMAKSKFMRLPAEARQEAIANALALTWMFIYRLWKKGRTRAQYPSVLLMVCLQTNPRKPICPRLPQGE